MLYYILIFIFVILIYMYVYYYVKQYKIKDAKEKIKKLKNTTKENISFNQIPKYYINLERSKNRNENMQKEIKKYNIKNIERIEAFDGKNIINIKEGEIQNYKYINNTQNKNKYELAISMSHLKAIRQAYDKNYQNIIIMEDDIEFFLLPHIKVDFNKILNILPDDCDILLLAHQHYNDFKILSMKEKNVRISGVCYLVTKQGMKKLNKYLNNKTFIFENELIWDHEIMRKLNIYHTNKSLFLFYNFKFDTEKENIKDLYFCSHSYSILNSYF